MTTVLDEPDDLKWLAEVHTPLAEGHILAILYDGESSPSRIELYKRNHIDCKPTVLEPDEEGNLKVIQKGE